MNFVSTEFLVFLAVTWLLFIVLPVKLRNPLLLLASYLFYATWSIPFVGVILLTTSIDYFASKLIFDSRSPGARKGILVGALTMNLLVLSFFKYGNFLLDANNSLLHLLGQRNPLPPHLDIILPLGISYYTFEAISYLVDTYRGNRPSRSWLEYNFYIMYFPHLISGPIIRFNELWPQYREGIRLPTASCIGRGFELLLFGFIFKIIIANGCASIADPIFNAPEKASTLLSWVAALAFTTQVYFDFLAYTHIARGVSLLFNIELPINFNHPFNAANISNFWERWQISLTKWIRDYVFIPLGGTRVPYPRILLNLFLIMFICGVWHGSGYRYVVWGAYYGLLVVAYYLFKTLRSKCGAAFEASLLNNRAYGVFSCTVTFMAVLLACVVFRSPELSNAVLMFNKMFRFKTLFKDCAQQIAQGNPEQLAVAVAMLVCCFAGPFLQKVYYRLIEQSSYSFKVQAATAAAILCWIFCSVNTQTFIYFQF